MKKNTFPGGGFVLTGVEHENWAVRMTAWYSADGELQDAERTDRAGRVMRVTQPQQRYLATLGPIWKDQ